MNQSDDIPVEPEAIKAAIRVRREAISIMLKEVAMLTDVLRAKLGPVAMLQWMNEQAKTSPQGTVNDQN
jgi:hypothetical protein